MPQPPPLSLGATTSGGETVFLMRSGTATRVEVCLIDSDAGRTRVRERRIEMERAGADLWQARVEAGPGTRYGYRAHGTHDPSRGLRSNPAKLLLDPYSRFIDEHPALQPAELDLLRDTAPDGTADDRDTLSIAPWSVVCGGRAPVPSTRPALPPGGRVIYEAHLEHLTAQLPDVPPNERGTFAALRSRHLVAHLASIGVTTLQLLPVMHWASEIRVAQRGQRNVWGYNPMGFFSPMPRYCTAEDIDGQWDEVAAAVAHLHAAGIEVVFDVVYNHTCEGASGDPTYHLRGLDNLRYYATEDTDPGSYRDVTGCGNTLDAGSPLVQELVVDSLRHWVSMTDVDGFRFDLATTLGRAPDFCSDHPLLRRISTDPVVGDRLLIAEPWDVGAGGYQLGAFDTATAGEPWAEWNDRFRTIVRDFWRPGHGSRAELATALAGSQPLWGDRPAGSSVGFVTAHDGFTLHDLVAYDHKHNLSNGEGNRDGTNDNQSWNGGVEGESDDARVRGLRLRRQGSMLGCLMLQVGTPMITAGDERGRTQRGNNNPYCLDADYLSVPWADAPEARHLTALTEAFAATRREHAALFDGGWLVPPGTTGGHVVCWLGRDGKPISPRGWEQRDKVLMAHYPASAGRGPLLVAVNGHSEAVDVCLPSEAHMGDWRVGIDTAGSARTGASVAFGARFTLHSFSLVVLAD